MEENSESTKDKRYTVEMLTKLFKKYLEKPEIRNKGYVMDGYPRSNEEAKTLFGPGKNKKIK